MPASAKKELSGFDIHRLVKELEPLKGGFIDKSYQLDRDAFLIRVNTKEGKKSLLIKIGSWMYLAEKSVKTPKTPSSYVMLLRKHLSNAYVSDIGQHEFDRVLEIRCRKEEEYTLVIELFGEGNIILVKGGVIVQPLFSKSWKHRDIRRGEKFEHPPARFNPLAAGAEVFKEALEGSGKDLVRTLAVDINLGGTYAEEACIRSGIPKEKNAGDLDKEERRRLFEEVKNIIKESEEGKAFVFSKDGVKVDAAPVRLVRYEGHDTTEFDSLNSALESYFGEGTEEQVPEKIGEREERILRRIRQQEDAIKKFEEDMASFKTGAEVLYGRYQEYDAILKELKSLSKKVPWDELRKVLDSHEVVLRIKPEKHEVTLKLDGVMPLVLDYRKDVNENAQMHYERMKRAKEKLSGVREALVKSEKRHKEERKRAEKKERLEKEREKVESTKRFWFDRFRWFLTSSGNIVVGGKDARTNDLVVKKYLKERDRYVHADIHGAPSVVIKRGEGEIDDISLQESCEFALIFSKAWSAKVGSGSAYWVRPEQVSKTPQPGEFLPKGAFVIRGKRNYTDKIDIRAAVGEIFFEGHRKVMCGPVPAVKAHSKRYVVIEPGEMKKEELAKRLSRTLNVPVDEIQSVLPPGNIRVVEKLGLELNDVPGRS